MLSRECYHMVLKCAYAILDFNEKHLSIFSLLLRDENACYIYTSIIMNQVLKVLKDIRIITLSYAEHFDYDFFKLEKTGYLTFSMNNNVTHSFVGNKIFLSPP